MKKLNDLPKDEFEGETYISNPIVSHVCSTHTKENWMTHIGYRDNKDGTASCETCNWGFRIPGYMRIVEGKVLDLRQR
jgi:hypothetical protein